MPCLLLAELNARTNQARVSLFWIDMITLNCNKQHVSPFQRERDKERERERKKERKRERERTAKKCSSKISPRSSFKEEKS